MITLENAQKILGERLIPRKPMTETINIHGAADRVLAEDVQSRMDIPPFDKSAMDGFAVMDDRDQYRILETVRAGSVGTVPLESGGCVRIMTGAPVPDGASRVIQVEFTEESAGMTRITKGSSATNICIQGEDIREGQVIARKGEILDCLRQSVIISCGIETVLVHRRVRAGIFSTGDELVTRFNEWGPGKIFDSNGPMLRQLLREHGVEIMMDGRLPDDLDPSIATLKSAIEQCDVVMLTGGVSMGDFDYLPQAMEASGLEILFSRLKVKPGKPMTLALNDQAVVLGYPGNPVSTFVMFHLFGIPVLNRLQGRTVEPRMMTLTMGRKFHRRKGSRLEFIPVIMDENGCLEPMNYHGSAHLAALTDADGFAVISPGITDLAKGDAVTFWPIRVKAYQ